jgi:predicted ATPase/DNA-binding SARP family transcriptional activator
LGPLQVVDDGANLDLGGPRQQRVLAVLLAATPNDVPVDRLIEEVWSEEPPNTAFHVVRTYVSNLRSIIGDRIISAGDRYRLDSTADESDADELALGLRRARELLDVDAAAALDLATRTLPLRRGRPFDGLGDDALSLRMKAAELEELYVQALEVRFEAALRIGQHQAAIPDLSSVVDIHPLRERFTAQLMLALYRSGRQAEALRAYQTLRRRLGEELGIDPSAEVQHLEERILLQDPGLALRPPHNIPAAVSSFVGRRVELGQVTKQVEAYRLVTLLGVGGVGKTRLAAEASTELLDGFPGGVWWIDLAPVDEPDQVPARTAEVLGVFAQPGVPLVQVLERFLSSRTALVVLDNCEHVLEPAGRLAAALLAAAPGLKILATSRRPLSVSGEVRYQVPAMSLPEEADGVGEIATSDAERLFLVRAQDVAPGASIVASAATDIARICVQLEGLPLAIEMAAARAAALSPVQIADRLAQDPGFLSAPEVDRAPRQRTIEAAIEWSYSLLSPAERTVFERVSVFAGGFDIEAATAAAGFAPIDPNDVLDAITGLVEASMLTARPSGEGPVRYRHLDAVRRFASSQLDQSGVRDQVEGRYSQYHLDLGRTSSEVRTTPAFAPWMMRFEAVRDELAPALDWSLDNEPRQRTLQALPGLLEYWQRRGDAAAAYRYGTRLMDDAEETPLELRAYALMCAAFGAALTGDFELASRAPQQALQLARDVPGWQCLLWALLNQGQVATILGDLPTIAAMGHEILALCDEHELTLQRAYGLALLAEGEFFSDGDYAAARRYADEAITGFRALDDIGALKIYGLSIAAPSAALQGDLDAAERYATEAISLPGAAWTAAAYVILGGYVLLPRGEVERARHVLQRGTTLAFETSTEIWMRFGLLFLARMAADAGQWEPAARLFGACRPNLPAWGQQSRWWNAEPAVRSALGEDRFEHLAAQGAAAKPEVIMGWIA